jgi:hypothetical protein
MAAIQEIIEQLPKKVQGRQEVMNIMGNVGQLREQEKKKQQQQLQEKIVKLESVEIFDKNLSYDARIFLRYIIIDALPPVETYSRIIVNTGFKKMNEAFDEYLEGKLTIKTEKGTDAIPLEKQRKKFLQGDYLHRIITHHILKQSGIQKGTDNIDKEILRILKEKKDESKESYPYKYFFNLGLAYKDIPHNSKFNNIDFLKRLIQLLNELYTALYGEKETEYLGSLRIFFMFYLFYYDTPTEKLIDEFVSICRANIRRNDLVDALKDFLGRLDTSNRFHTTMIRFIQEKIREFSDTKIISESRFESMIRFRTIFDKFEQLKTIFKPKLNDLENN